MQPAANPAKPPPAATGIYAAIARALAPRPALTVSEWADQERRLSSKGSAMAGQWVTAAMVEIRQRLENLATSIAPIVAAQADEAAVRATLREAFDHTLKSASHHFDQLKKAASTI